MKKLSKKQEWAIVIVICFVIAGAIGASYYLLTMDEVNVATNNETSSTVTADETELTEIESDLTEIDELDLSELDAINDDLESTDLTELE
ncbi:MAG: hypothetical protein PHW75_02815 [Patescibacteria group bacterium]|nr:hypothetical protein [Patescibacteria group bacterium]